MRFQLSLFALASAAFVAAQDLPDLPSDVPQCFVTCLTSADAGDCDLTDFECLCSNDAFVKSLSECAQSSCDSQDDIDNGIQAAEGICSSAGVTLPSTSIEISSTASASESASDSDDEDNKDEDSDNEDDDSAAQKSLVNAAALAAAVFMAAI